MSGAVILHPDEHLESHDPFQHRHTDNQPLASVTAVHSPHPGLITGICGKKDIISSGSRGGRGRLLPTPPLLPTAHMPNAGREEQAAKARAAEARPPDRCLWPLGYAGLCLPWEEACRVAHLFLHVPTWRTRPSLGGQAVSKQ